MDGLLMQPLSIDISTIILVPLVVGLLSIETYSDLLLALLP